MDRPFEHTSAKEHRYMVPMEYFADKVGMKLSLLNYAQFRYEGILLMVDLRTHSLVVGSVRFFGTEDRQVDKPVAALAEIQQYLIFKDSTIQEIYIISHFSPLPGAEEAQNAQASKPPQTGRPNDGPCLTRQELGAFDYTPYELPGHWGPGGPRYWSKYLVPMSMYDVAANSTIPKTEPRSVQEMLAIYRNSWGALNPFNFMAYGQRIRTEYAANAFFARATPAQQAPTAQMFAVAMPAPLVVQVPRQRAARPPAPPQTAAPRAPMPEAPKTSPPIAPAPLAISPCPSGAVVQPLGAELRKPKPEMKSKETQYESTCLNDTSLDEPYFNPGTYQQPPSGKSAPFADGRIQRAAPRMIELKDFEELLFNEAYVAKAKELLAAEESTPSDTQTAQSTKTERNDYNEMFPKLPPPKFQKKWFDGDGKTLDTAAPKPATNAKPRTRENEPEVPAVTYYNRKPANGKYYRSSNQKENHGGSVYYVSQKSSNGRCNYRKPGKHPLGEYNNKNSKH